MKPKVSVLVIAYNQEGYIRTALESVFAQRTNFPFEVVVSDDASTDGTRSIIGEFAARYADQVRLSYRDKNFGDEGIENVLLGLEMCRAEYIAMLDGDDYWTDPGKLQRQGDFLDARPDYPLCFHNCRIVYEEAGRESWNTTRPLHKESITTEDLLENAMVQMSTIMMRREVAGQLRNWPELLTDWFIGLLASRSGPVGYIDRVMSVYRQHARSYFTSISRAGQWVKFIDFYKQLEEVLGEAHRDAIERAICVRSYLAATEYERARDFANAGKFLSLALRGQPAWLEPYCADSGLTGDEFFRKLAQRLRLYRFPLLLRLQSVFEPSWREVRWRWLAARIRIQSHIRLKRREPVGFIIASPNPVHPLSSPGRAGVDLVWTSATDVVEVRVGRPDGPLLSRTLATGKTKTGEWVADGTVFYLQNVFGDLPLTRENTMDVVRITVKG